MRIEIFNFKKSYLTSILILLSTCEVEQDTDVQGYDEVNIKLKQKFMKILRITKKFLVNTFISLRYNTNNRKRTRYIHQQEVRKQV